MVPPLINILLSFTLSWHDNIFRFDTWATFLFKEAHRITIQQVQPTSSDCWPHYYRTSYKFEYTSSIWLYCVLLCWPFLVAGILASISEAHPLGIITINKNDLGGLGAGTLQDIISSVANSNVYSVAGDIEGHTYYEPEPIHTVVPIQISIIASKGDIEDVQGTETASSGKRIFLSISSEEDTSKDDNATEGKEITLDPSKEAVKKGKYSAVLQPGQTIKSSGIII